MVFQFIIFIILLVKAKTSFTEPEIFTAWTPGALRLHFRNEQKSYLEEVEISLNLF